MVKKFTCYPFISNLFTSETFISTIPWRSKESVNTRANRQERLVWLQVHVF